MIELKSSVTNIFKKYDTIKKIKEIIRFRGIKQETDTLDLKDILYKRTPINELFD